MTDPDSRSAGSTAASEALLGLLPDMLDVDDCRDVLVERLPVIEAAARRDAEARSEALRAELKRVEVGCRALGYIEEADRMQAVLAKAAAPSGYWTPERAEVIRKALADHEAGLSVPTPPTPDPRRKSISEWAAELGVKPGGDTEVDWLTRPSMREDPDPHSAGLTAASEALELLNSLGIAGLNIRHALSDPNDPKVDPEVAALTAGEDWCVCGRLWPCEAQRLADILGSLRRES